MPEFSTKKLKEAGSAVYDAVTDNPISNKIRETLGGAINRAEAKRNTPGDFSEHMKSVEATRKLNPIEGGGSGHADGSKAKLATSMRK